jgi:hypothetical protein
VASDAIRIERLLFENKQLQEWQAIYRKSGPAPEGGHEHVG